MCLHFLSLGMHVCLLSDDLCSLLLIIYPGLLVDLNPGLVFLCRTDSRSYAAVHGRAYSAYICLDGFIQHLLELHSSPVYYVSLGLRVEHVISLPLLVVLLLVATVMPLATVVIVGTLNGDGGGTKGCVYSCL